MFRIIKEKWDEKWEHYPNRMRHLTDSYSMTTFNDMLYSVYSNEISFGQICVLSLGFATNDYICVEIQSSISETLIL